MLRPSFSSVHKSSIRHAFASNVGKSVFSKTKLDRVEHDLIIDTIKFNYVSQVARSFFQRHGFIETHPQNRVSILAACEDPANVASYEYLNQKWPLPQTGQMWLEYELLQNPKLQRVFCVSTSYRVEPNMVRGRHFPIFPMIEFESLGNFSDLRSFVHAFCRAFSFKDFAWMEHDTLAEAHNETEITHKIENSLFSENEFEGVFIQRFPEHTNPFWNMRREETSDHALKIDVILGGQETIGAAERSVDAQQMAESFFTIENGAYAQKLFDLFGEERVLDELDDFLSLEMIDRYGGGIGVTRLIQAIDSCPNARQAFDDYVWQIEER